MEPIVEFVNEWLSRGWIRAPLILLGALVVAWLVDFVFRKVVARLSRRTRTDLDDRLTGLLRKPIFLSILMIGFYLAVRTLGPSAALLRVVVSLLHTLAVFIWLFAGLKICSTLIEGMSRLAGRVQWLEERTVPLFDNLAKIVLTGGAIYCLLLAWDLDVTPWLASAGIAGIAIGFAAKDTLANLFGGLFVIADAPYKIGDFINLEGGERGRVVKIGLRSTRLITRDDIEVTLPNAQIANSKIVNESGGRWEKSRVTVHVGVAYGSDVDRVRTVLLAAAVKVPHVLGDPEPRVRFQEMGDSALIFRVLCWIEEPVLRGQCIDGLNTEIYKALNAEGINIPFPQRDLHVRSIAPIELPARNG